MRIAYFDCFAGVSGDMILGALLDAGLPLADLRACLEGLRLPGWRLEATRVTKQGIAATQAHVQVDPAAEQPHRHLHDILHLLAAGDLPNPVRSQAQAVFERLADAEAAVHGTSRDQVHFHEVGAIDSIVDITGAVCGLYLLGCQRVQASPLPLGHGFVRAAHGLLPVPAPAVIQLLAARGVPVRDRDVTGELVTPTGAAILAELAADFGPYPAMTLRAAGFGAGQRDASYPNLLRLVVGENSQPADGQVDNLLLLETNIDDMNPQVLAYVSQQLLAAGALDVWQTPIIMKKGRAGVLLSVLCTVDGGEAAVMRILTETSSLGVRRQAVERLCLPRSFVVVQTPWGPVRLKVAQMAAGQRKVAPEYEDCRALAAALGVPLREVMQAALAASSVETAPLDGAPANAGQEQDFPSRR